MKNNFLSASGLSKVFEKVKNFVKPNPPLIGTEEALTGLEINGIKFKAGGETPHLYWHTVLVQGVTDYASMITNKSFSFYCIILSTDNTALTAQSFADLVIGANGAQFLTFSSWIEISGTPESRVEVSYIQKDSATRVRIMPLNSNNYGTFGVNQIGYITDAVNQIF